MRDALPSPAALDLPVGFQPLVDAESDGPFAWRAVVEGPGGKGFDAVLGMLEPEHRHALDCLRATIAIRRAMASAMLAGGASLILPVNAAGARPDAMLAHLFRTALAHDLPLDQLVVELNADERGDLVAVAGFALACQARGIAIALSGFSAGPLGLKLLARHSPRFLTLDAGLVRDLAASESRRLIVDGVLRLARRMDALVIAPAATREQLAATAGFGIRHILVAGLAASVRAVPMPPRRDARGMAAGSTPQHRRLAHHVRAIPMPPRPVIAAAALHA